MSCRPPEIHSLRYMLAGVPSAGAERYTIHKIEGSAEYAAVEIDASSEVDCALVKHETGFAYVAVGAPAIGPFRGPLLIQNWRRTLPYSDSGQGYTESPLTTYPPLLAVKAHFQMPPGFQNKRGPAERQADDFTTSGAYVNRAEFPFYGRRIARIGVSCVSTGAGEVPTVGDLSYKVFGRNYRAVRGYTEGDPISSFGSDESDFFELDSTGALVRTVVIGESDFVVIDGELWDTLVVSVITAAGASAGGVVHFTAED